MNESLSGRAEPELPDGTYALAELPLRRAALQNQHLPEPIPSQRDLLRRRSLLSKICGN